MQIHPLFRAGWEAFAPHNNGDIYAPEDEERHLQAAWEDYTGASGVPLPPLDPNAFVDGWNRTIATISVFADTYNLPKPDMIFHPRWLESIRLSSNQRISSTLVHMGVRVKFATWQQVEALKEI